MQRPARLPPSMLAWCAKRLGGGKGDGKQLARGNGDRSEARETPAKRFGGGKGDPSALGGGKETGRQHTSKIQMALTGAGGEGLGGLGVLGGLGMIGRSLSDPSPLPLNKETSVRELKPAAPCSAVQAAPLSSRTGAAGN